jgi:diguanylate cyclase (GGDEF)-like protein
MIINLREHKDLQHRLSHRDSLTGLRNTTSYKGWVIDFDKKIKEDSVEFAVAVLDINNLKEINDTYGHSFGNELIVTASRIISDTFKRSPVFRIGGDEFLVILQNRDLADKEKLFANIDLECAATYIDKENVRFPVSLAKGFSAFDPEKDTQFSDVFERADNEMYKNKRDMKNLNK